MYLLPISFFFLQVFPAPESLLPASLLPLNLSPLGLVVPLSLLLLSFSYSCLSASLTSLSAVLRIRIRMIYMFLGLPDLDPLVRDMDPNLDPSIINQK